MGNFITRLCGMTRAQEESIVKRMQIPIVWFLGGPGSGKTTMAHRICDRYKFTYISMGDLLAHEVEHNTKIGKEILDQMSDGKLVSRDILFALIQHCIATHASYSQGYILDGYPREIEQRIDLETKIAECSMLLYFKCSDDTMKIRMYATEEAPDNTISILETRKYIYKVLTKVSNFHKFSGKLINFYPDPRRVITIDAEQDKLKVYVQCRKHMDQLIRKLKREVMPAYEEDMEYFI